MRLARSAFVRVADWKPAYVAPFFAQYSTKDLGGLPFLICLIAFLSESESRPWPELHLRRSRQAEFRVLKVASWPGRISHRRSAQKLGVIWLVCPRFETALPSLLPKCDWSPSRKPVAESSR